MIQSEHEYLLKNDYQVNTNQNYLNKAIFGLGFLGSLGCTAVQVLTITEVISTKNSKWILLAGAISFIGISIYGLVYNPSLKKDEPESRFNVVEISESTFEKNIEIEKISNRVKEILFEHPEIDELQNSFLIVTNPNPVLEQLDAIQNFIEKTKIKIDELKAVGAEKESLLKKISLPNSEQKRLLKELEEANEKRELSEFEVQSLQLKMQVFAGHLGAVNLLLGNEGTEISFETTQKVRSFITMLVSTDIDSSASASATSSPFILLSNKNAHRPSLGNIPKFDING